MRMSELVSALTPSQYAQAALIIFAAVFVAVTWRYRRQKPVFDQYAAMPLMNDEFDAAASSNPTKAA